MAHRSVPALGLTLSAPALKQIDELREKLRDAEETLSAIRTGEVDALVVNGPTGRQQIYTLKGADQPYRVLVESMNEGALTLSRNGTILYCNARMARLVGRPLERMMGQRIGSFIVNGDAAKVQALLKRSAGPGKLTVKLRHAGGHAPAQLSLTPIDLDGATAFCAIVTDLSDAYAVRQAMLQKDAGLRLVAEAAPAVLFTTDVRGRVVSSTGNGLKTIAGQVEALLSSPAAGSRRRMSARGLMLQAVKAGRASYDTQFAGRVWNVNLERLGMAGLIGVAVDVTGERTEREAAESRLRECRQRDYVANVSHEFRTPLAAIQGYAETLLRGALDDKENAKPFVKTIERQAARLSELVENLLFLSTLESGRLKPKPRPLDANALMRDLLKDLRPLASRRKVAIDLAVPKGTKVHADAAQLRRVLMNVAGNAIKYNREGGRLSISSQQENGHVRLSVADTGIGIKARDLPRIFERFHRSSDARRRAIKGTGLGLSIAKTLVESNNGRIWAESRPGKGTRFTIQLPAKP